VALVAKAGGGGDVDADEYEKRGWGLGRWGG